MRWFKSSETDTRCFYLNALVNFIPNTEIIIDCFHNYNRHFQDYLTQEQVVMEGISCDPRLDNAYNLMQDFMAALKARDTNSLKEIINSNNIKKVNKKRQAVGSVFRLLRLPDSN